MNSLRGGWVSGPVWGKVLQPISCRATNRRAARSPCLVGSFSFVYLLPGQEIRHEEDRVGMVHVPQVAAGGEDTGPVAEQLPEIIYLAGPHDDVVLIVQQANLSVVFQVGLMLRRPIFSIRAPWQTPGSFFR